MRIELAQTGGIAYFPGLNRPVVLDVDHLDGPVAQELKRLVEAADFFNLPPLLGSPRPGAADCQAYRLSIEDGGRRHSVQALVPLQNPALTALVQAIQKQRKAAAKPPGSAC